MIAVDVTDWDKILGLFFLRPEHIDDFGMPKIFEDFFPNFLEPLEVEDGPVIVKTLCPAFFQFYADSEEARKDLLKAREELLVKKGTERTLQ